MSKARVKRLERFFGRFFFLSLLAVAGLALAKPATADDYSWTGNADGDSLYAANDCDDYNWNDPQECSIGIMPATPMWYEYGGTPSCTEGITVRRCFPNGYCEDVTYLRNCN
jgi:hypothetical protein